jgi:glutamate dehydrogenase (NADP+)
MPTTNAALNQLRGSGMVVAPSKAVNAGGVATSALEMCQNAMHYAWPEREVDDKLREIMRDIHDISAAAAEEYDLGYDLVSGANIAGFLKIADAMLLQGVV